MAPVVGLVALLAVDGALIVWAVRPLPAEVAGTVASAGPTMSPSTPTATPSASPTSEQTPSATPMTISARPLTRIAGAADDAVVWVAESGTCERPGTVWVSSDGGDSWSDKAAPGRVLRVKPETGTAAFVTGGDADCALRLWSTSDGANSWGAATSAAKAWSRVPDDARSVNTPSGADVAPCTDSAKVVDLAPADASTAFVLCDDDEVRSTADGGDVWRDLVTVEGALAIALTPDASAALVVRSTADCKGVRAATVRDGDSTDGACIRSTPKAGRVAAATSGSRWWIVVGNKVYGADEPEGTWEATGSTLPS